MSRDGPVSRAGLSLPGSLHVCLTQQKSTSRFHDNRASLHRSSPAHVIRPLGPVHSYPDIFESANFPFRIQKFLHPRVAKFT